jgi:hypothetical protein
MTVSQETRDARKDQTAEVFTPIELVNEMLDKLPLDVWEEGKTFADPSCGNGNFLVEVLKRKLALNHDPLVALSTIAGVELMEDNVAECHQRLLEVLPDGTDLAEAKKLLDHNIVCHDSLTWNWDGWQLAKPYQDKPKFKFNFGLKK